jgi:uncharacterized FAD-dependent dehydrogenase
MDSKNPTPKPNTPKTSRPDETPSRETRTGERPLTDNQRHVGTEQDEKVRRSNLAGDQDVDDADSDETDR